MADGAGSTLPQPSWGSARSVDEFDKLEQIGEGTYGQARARHTLLGRPAQARADAHRAGCQVYMARNRTTGEIVALKKVRMVRLARRAAVAGAVC